MITDLTDPRCNPKSLFRKFKKYLNSTHLTKQKTFTSAKVLIWLSKQRLDDGLSSAVETLPKILACWEQCGFIESFNDEENDVTIRSPIGQHYTVKREWKIITRRKQ